eukprot:TRINITY_DN29517_c0_g1_i1.p1 TRINITY_DN29517_c0_g1~~TRINITY_DN29517_c0_g1_i1.p1  ORF type:complete len:910 (+),score=156.45 TRINITY_DN29517_c0_g1_i1:79-2808(+)
MSSLICCRGICGNRGDGKNGMFDSTLSRLGDDIFEGLEDVDEPRLEVPQVAGLLTYSASLDQPLRGPAITEGTIWYLSAEKAELVKFSLFVNGFSFRHSGGEVKVALSPFALVRTCKLQGNSGGAVHLSNLKIFKISLFTHGTTFFFGIHDDDAEDDENAAPTEESVAEAERARWVLDVSRVVRCITQSLYRPTTIVCDPIVSVAATQRRLMAGYLLHHELDGVVSMAYCELHAHSRGAAKLRLYENELCQVPVADIRVTANTSCCERIGVDCSCFCIEDHQFSARTLAERRVWLRAVSNVKVKLRNEAHSPTREEMRHFRAAIHDHVQEVSAKVGEAHVALDPLLQRCPQRRPHPVSTVCTVSTVVDPIAVAQAQKADDPRPHPPGHARPELSAGRVPTKASSGTSVTDAAVVGKAAYDGDRAGGLLPSAASPRGPERAVESAKRGVSSESPGIGFRDAEASALGAADVGAGGSLAMARFSPMTQTSGGQPASPTSSPRRETAMWNSGVVRVLLVVGSGSDAESRTRYMDSAARLQQWFDLCGLKDVTLQEVGCGAPLDDGKSAPGLAALRETVLAICERCQSGDTLFLQFLGLDNAYATFGNGTAGLLGPLPQYSTLICIADSPVVSGLIGLDPTTLANAKKHSAYLRTVLFVISAYERNSDSAAHHLPALSASAMLRAADSLSLVDGPCSVSCGDFFQELAEQLQDLGLALGTPPPRMSLQAYPRHDTADEVPWPIVAAPRNPGKAAQPTAVAPAVAQTGTTWHVGAALRPQWQQRAEQSPEKILAPKFGTTDSLRDALNIVPEQSSSSARSSPRPSSIGGAMAQKVPSSNSDSDRSGQRRPKKNARGLPMDLSGLSMLLTGGGLGNEPAGRSARRQVSSGGGHGTDTAAQGAASGEAAKSCIVAV